MRGHRRRLGLDDENLGSCLLEGRPPLSSADAGPPETLRPEIGAKGVDYS